MRYRLVSPPPRPPSGRLPTGCAAVSGQQMPWVERAARIPASRQRRCRQHAGACLREERGYSGAGPKGGTAPEGQASGRSVNFAPRRFIAQRPTTDGSRPDRATLSPALRVSYRRPAHWHRFRRDPATAILARYRRKTGILIRCYQHLKQVQPLEPTTGDTQPAQRDHPARLLAGGVGEDRHRGVP